MLNLYFLFVRLNKTKVLKLINAFVIRRVLNDLLNLSRSNFCNDELLASSMATFGKQISSIVHEIVDKLSILNILFENWQNIIKIK